MIGWFRRVDPAFYHKEPLVLRSQAQIARYTDEAQAEVRLSVLSVDQMLHIATTIVALSAYAAAIGADALDPRRDWVTVWAFAVLAVAAPRALPWWPPGDARATWRHALIGSALIVIPALWTRIDSAVLGIALLTGATLYVTRGRGRVALLVVAVGVLFGVRMLAYPVFVAPLVGILAAGAAVLGAGVVARVWRLRPQMAMWSAFATLLVVWAYTCAFDAPAVALRMPAEIAAIALAYLGVCIIAGRIRRAERIARPNGALSSPQSIVPLLDLSHHHAIICWIE